MPAKSCPVPVSMDDLCYARLTCCLCARQLIQCSFVLIQFVLKNIIRNMVSSQDTCFQLTPVAKQAYAAGICCTDSNTTKIIFSRKKQCIFFRRSTPEVSFFIYHMSVFHREGSAVLMASLAKTDKEIVFFVHEFMNDALAINWLLQVPERRRLPDNHHSVTWSPLSN